MNDEMNKLYTGNEAFKLFKSTYYKYCNYKTKYLREIIKKLAENDFYKYANDYSGVQINALQNLLYFKRDYDDDFNMNRKYLFNIFVVTSESFNDDILIKNGVFD